MHRTLHDLPEGYKFLHLKRQTVKKLIQDRNYMSGKLKCHLNKTKLTYEEAVTAIIDNNTEQDKLPRDLGDFMLAAISQTIERTILVVKPTIETKKDANGIEQTVYNAYTEYLFFWLTNRRSATAGATLSFSCTTD